MSTTTLWATLDTFVDSGFPATVYGDWDDLYVGDYWGEYCYDFVLFDVSTLIGKTINSATFSVYMAAADAAIALVAQDINETWDEYATWNTKPTFGANFTSATVSKTALETSGWLSLM